MSVIVINVASWPTFTTLVRSDLIDLYAEDSGVEVWDATAPGLNPDKSEFAVWGHWPKQLAPSPHRVRGELLDRIRHLADDGIDRLTVIIILDRVEHAMQPAAGRAALPAQAIVAEILLGLGAPETERRRVTFIGAIRAGGGDEAAHAGAFDIAKPARGGQGSLQDRLFDVVVFLGKSGAQAAGERGDRLSVTALRVAVDLARDPGAARQLFQLPDRSREGRVLVLSPPAAIESPATRLRNDVVALIDRALAAQDDRAQDDRAQDGSTERIEQAVSEVITRIDESDIGRAIAKVATIDQATGRLAPNADLERLWQTEKPPPDPAWNDVVEIARARDLFAASAASVDAYRGTRDARLEAQREALDTQVRETQALLRERVEAASVDPAFGLAQRFAGRLDEQRKRLVHRLEARSAAATAHRARRLDLLEREQAGPADARLAAPADRVLDALERWLPASAVRGGIILLVLVVAFIAWPLLFAPEATWWPLWVPAVVVLISAAGGALLYNLRRKLERARREAIANYLAAQAAELESIRKVSDEGLAQVVSARIAGAITPFVDDLRRHARANEQLRRTMEAVERNLRAGLDRATLAQGAEGAAEGAAPLAAFDDGRDVPDRFRLLLWTHKSVPMMTATVSFTETRGALEFASSLRFADPITIETPSPPGHRANLSGGATAPPQEGLL